VLTVLSVLICAFWVSICAAAPEFIWQGLLLALDHVDTAELLGALLIGLVLAFFVEPVTEQIKRLLERQHVDHQPRDALFAAGLALTFALASVCLHEAMTALVSLRAGQSGLQSGIQLTVSWAIVPFTITLAWLSVGWRWLAVPTGIVACGASSVTAWLFSWPVQSVITTTIPCVLILGLGYRSMLRLPTALAPCARIVVFVGAMWLVAALLFEAAVRHFDRAWLALYDAPSFWMDVRFYAGWAVGLALAPSPFRR
jgi:hypothetical protein